MGARHSRAQEIAHHDEGSLGSPGSPGSPGSTGPQPAVALVARAIASHRRPITVLIDGPAGAGKSTLADHLRVNWPTDANRPAGTVPTLVRMDDLYPGWSGLDAGITQLTRDLLAPRASGLPAGWRAYDWAAGRPGQRHSVDPDAPLIVEGCGTLAGENADLADACIWLDADDGIRKPRALARDRGAFDAHWDQWQAQFEAYVRRESPRSSAHLVLDISSWHLEPHAP